MVEMKNTPVQTKVIIRAFINAVSLYAALVINLLLVFRFYLMLYFPGTLHTAFLFKLTLPGWKVFSYVCLLLNGPMTAIVQALPPQLLVGVKAGFPVMPASVLMAYLTHQPLAVCKTQYPGQVEWLTLLSIFFWDLLFLLFLSVGLGSRFLRENMDWGAMFSESQNFLSERQMKWQLNRKVSAKLNEQASDSGTFGVKDQATGHQLDARTLARLSKAKEQSAPGIIIKPTMADWEQYKEAQGDLMVNDMLRQLRRENASLHAQQDSLRSTFSKYFSPTVLEYLEANRGSFQSVHNEKHQISVLFCDIRGFSTFSQTASSDEVVKLLSEYFEITSHIILNKYNGVVSKLMGDGLMAYWGFPVPAEEHAYIATCAALDIMRQIEYRNQCNPGQPPLNIGIGIATGEAVVGNIGSSDFKDFTLIGPAVNMAARLEECNKTLKTRLLISEATYQGLRGKIACRNCGQIDLRGWQERQQVYAPDLDRQ